MKSMKEKNTIYLPLEMQIAFLGEEDVIRTSYVADNNGAWEDEDAEAVKGSF